MIRSSDKPAMPLIVEGIDCRSFDDEAVQMLKRQIFDHKVVVMRHQVLQAAEYAAFVRRLGDTIPHVLEQHALPGLRDIIRITNLYDEDGRPIGVHDGGTYWHTDMSYLPQPDVFTSLFAVETPPRGGQTLFIDCEKGLRELMERRGLGPSFDSMDPMSVRVRHRFGNRDTLRNDRAAAQTLSDGQISSLPPEVIHPLVRRHKIVGHPALYAIAGTSFEIVGWSQSRSHQILDGLFDQLLADAPVYEHSYRNGDLVIWDNATTLHRGVEIPPTTQISQCRMLYRANIAY